jgi:hypothetical protein
VYREGAFSVHAVADVLPDLASCAPRGRHRRYGRTPKMMTRKRVGRYSVVNYTNSCTAAQYPAFQPPGCRFTRRHPHYGAGNHPEGDRVFSTRSSCLQERDNGPITK